jgi:hypothetical protein
LIGFGALPCLAVALGTGLLIVFDWKRAMLILPFPVLYCLFMGYQKLFFARFLLPIYPCMAVLAGFGIYRLMILWNHGIQSYHLIGLKRLTAFGRSFLAVLLVGIILSLPAAASINNNWVLSQKNTRLRVRDWVKENMHPGAKVVADFDASAALSPAFGDRLPIQLVSNSTVNIVKDWNRHRFEQERIEFVLVSSNLLSLYAWDSTRHKQVSEFIDQLESRAVLVTTISPLDDTPLHNTEFIASGDVVFSLYPAIAGPSIRVYKLHQSCDRQ